MPTPLKERYASLSSQNRRGKSFLNIAIGFVVVLVSLAGCRGWTPLDDGQPTLELTSTSIYQGEIQKAFTCDGAEASPELAWAAPPPVTQSFALIAVDRDSPFGFAFVHWILYNLPADTRELLERVPQQDHLPDGSRQGQNDFDKTGYAGPCPPRTKGHRYIFALYALDLKLNLPAQATRKQVENAMKGHILARGQLTGHYRR